MVLHSLLAPVFPLSSGSDLPDLEQLQEKRNTPEQKKPELDHVVICCAYNNSHQTQSLITLGDD